MELRKIFKLLFKQVKDLNEERAAAERVENPEVVYGTTIAKNALLGFATALVAEDAEQAREAVQEEHLLDLYKHVRGLFKFGHQACGAIENFCLVTARDLEGPQHAQSLSDKFRQIDKAAMN